MVAKDHMILGVIHLKDIIKSGVKGKFADLRKMGIRTVMITGDNPSPRQPSQRRQAWMIFWQRPRLRESSMIRELQAKGAHGGNDRRRNQRCSRTGTGRCGGCYEHRYPGRKRGRKHGGPDSHPQS